MLVVSRVDCPVSLGVAHHCIFVFQSSRFSSLRVSKTLRLTRSFESSTLPYLSRSANVRAHTSGIILRSVPPSPWGGHGPGIVGFEPVQVAIEWDMSYAELEYVACSFS